MANKNKKTFTYNQAYSRGAQIAQDLQRSIAQRSADYAAPYVEGVWAPIQMSVILII